MDREQFHREVYLPAKRRQLRSWLWEWGPVILAGAAIIFSVWLVTTGWPS